MDGHKLYALLSVIFLGIHSLVSICDLSHGYGVSKILIVSCRLPIYDCPIKTCPARTGVGLLTACQ